MEAQVIFALSLAILFFYGAESATFTFRNNCPYTVWPGILTGGGGPQLSSKTGFELAPHGKQSVKVPATWKAGRAWARTHCSKPAGKFTCATGDCGPQVACNGAGGAPPTTLAEFTLGVNGKDFYDVSNVDGFNLPLSITPQGGSGDKCKTTSCPANSIISQCPPKLAFKGPDGNTIACKSACEAFGGVKYCCKPDDTPKTCPPTKYSKFFKDRCPQAYSYAKDDQSSTFSCEGGPNYLITFCP